MSESNAERARRSFEALARGDLDVVAQLLDPDVQWHGGEPGPMSCHNRHEALGFIRQARASNRIGQLEDVVDAGERVVVIMRPPPDRADGPDDLRGERHDLP